MTEIMSWWIPCRRGAGYKCSHCGHRTTNNKALSGTARYSECCGDRMGVQQTMPTETVIKPSEIVFTVNQIKYTR